ncbi:glycosyltransferase family 2 protein [Citreicella sp. C3M06]|uniref:glycosyltransferase family 2 protein n=1 Tax=Citreicella sp. C3M06 TaxID=2841564 RepID=UPI001C0946B3|nr:glycosyltransferase family 2 protein [Citreicella sp. C3M06]MBU2960822.1 glycosyltransferase family 2 protein [Citreicella sp. C3M06]
MTAPTLSCIIPAFNEAPRIGAVLDAVLDHPLIHEIVVIDDGSSDDTAARAQAVALRAPHLRVIRLERNGGKTRAVTRGIAEATSSHILLLDSDLLGLHHDELTALIAPVLEGRADASLSLRGNAPLVWRGLGIDYISGERVMRRELLASRAEALQSLPKFGLEVFINGLWIEQGLKIAVVRWPGVESPMKHEKRGGWLMGLKADAAMLGDIFHTVTPLETLRQVFRLRQRRVPGPGLAASDHH